ncbi:MAG: hypothetical protein AAFO04_07495 [Cyanobacteria bacterium J06592_8]
MNYDRLNGHPNSYLNGARKPTSSGTLAVGRGLRWKSIPATAPQESRPKMIKLKMVNDPPATMET